MVSPDGVPTRQGDVEVAVAAVDVIPKSPAVRESAAATDATTESFNFVDI
jgi:hypothetical protein